MLWLVLTVVAFDLGATYFWFRRKKNQLTEAEVFRTRSYFAFSSIAGTGLFLVAAYLLLIGNASTAAWLIIAGAGLLYLALGFWLVCRAGQQGLEG